MKTQTRLSLWIGLISLALSTGSRANQTFPPNFQAVYNGTFQLTPDGNITRKVISGKGFHTILGASTSLFEGTLKPAPTGSVGFVIEGTTTLTDSAGEKLVARTTGRILPAPKDAAMVELDYDFTFDGGSGRYAYASGKAHVMGTARFKDQVSGTATWCMDGRLDLGFKAAYDNTFKLSPGAAGSAVFNKEIVGKGFNTLIGESSVRFVGTANLSAAPYPIEGTTTFTDNEGHELTARTTGKIIPDTKDLTLVKLDYNYEFTGGTGKFKGATGTAHVLGSAVFADQVSGKASWCMEGGLILLEQLPAMSVQPTAAGLKVSWTQNNGRWNVESSRNLGLWSALNLAADRTGLQRSVALSGDEAQGFFRLRKSD